MASAGLYANHLHLVPDTQPHQDLTTKFFTGWMLFLMPKFQLCESALALTITKYTHRRWLLLELLHRLLHTTISRQKSETVRYFTTTILHHFRTIIFLALAIINYTDMTHTIPQSTKCVTDCHVPLMRYRKLLVKRCKLFYPICILYEVPPLRLHQWIFIKIFGIKN